MDHPLVLALLIVLGLIVVRLSLLVILAGGDFRRIRLAIRRRHKGLHRSGSGSKRTRRLPSRTVAATTVQRRSALGRAITRR